MAIGEPRDLSLLADILETYVAQIRAGQRPRYLYVPPGAVMELADDVRWLLAPHDEASAWLAEMVMVERPEIEEMGYRALLLEEALPAN